MKLLLYGHTHSYQLQSLSAMFFPLEPQETVTLDRLEQLQTYQNTRSDETLIYAGVEGASPTGRVLIRLHGVMKEHTCSLPSLQKGDVNNALCGLVYQILQQMTGITLPYGIYTGIRPVKTVNTWRRQGLSDLAIQNRLKNVFYVTPQKISLALQTADAQAKMLQTVQKDSYSLFVFIPFCPSKCRYCSFVSDTIAKNEKLVVPYVQALCEDLKVTAQAARDMKLTLDSVYIGGGTPTALPPDLLGQVMETIATEFPLQKSTEYTVEAGRPDTITKEHLKTIRAFGGNRISINPQTFCDETLRAMGRNHTAYDVLRAYALAREEGFHNINMDLIAALPGETPEIFAKSLETAISLKPENLTVHTLTLKRAAALRSDEMADPVKEMQRSSEAARMLECAGEWLPNAEYLPYYLYRQKNTVGTLENVGWSKEGYACRYNVLIMEECQNILACGANASSKLLQKPDGARLFRIFQDKFPYDYINHLPQILETKRQFQNFIQSDTPVPDGQKGCL